MITIYKLIVNRNS